MFRRTTIAALAATLAVPSAALAHVTVQPTTAEAGSYTVQNVRVPNESETESVVKVQLRMPPGFDTVRTQPIPGWSAEVTRAGDLVEEVTWTSTSDTGRIAPGEFLEFPISVKIPDAAGDLVYKAVETYDGGKVSRWIGAPDTDNPAPVVEVTPATGDGHGGAATAEVADVRPASATVAEDDGRDALTLALAIVAVVLAGGALVRTFVTR